MIFSVLSSLVIVSSALATCQNAVEPNYPIQVEKYVGTGRWYEIASSYSVKHAFWGSNQKCITQDLNVRPDGKLSISNSAISLKNNQKVNNQAVATAIFGPSKPGVLQARFEGIPFGDYCSFRRGVSSNQGELCCGKHLD